MRSAAALVVVVAALVAAAAPGGAGALRVLAAIPVGAKSHHVVLHGLLRGLAERGHHVTAIELFAPSPLPPNYTHVALSDAFFAPYRGTWNIWDMTDMSYFARVLMLWGMGNMVAGELLRQAPVQALLHDASQRFDVVVVEAFFNEAFLGLGHHFGAPVVQVCPYVGSSWMFEAVGTPNQYSYVPDPFLSYSDHMTFEQRLFNAVFGTFQAMGRSLYFLPGQDAAMRRWIPPGRDGAPLPSLAELQRSTALLLVNSHVALSYARPLTPNAVPVGGMHVPPARQLPQDLLKFITEAKDGVVYFAMGSNLNCSEMPREKLEALVKVFGSLKQRVLWKYEADTLPGKPSNVMIRKWLPQVDILAHPNVRIFITHGGLLSSLEALQYGVPLVGIPVFGDQQMNMEKAESSGYAIQINYKDLSADRLQHALQEILTNTKYRESAKRLSKILMDQPEKPLERAIWWIEYIVRHKGAHHLRSGALNLTWYQYHLLDVIIVVIAVVLLVSLTGLWCLMYIYRRIFSKKPHNKEKTKKTN